MVSAFLLRHGVDDRFDVQEFLFIDLHLVDSAQRSHIRQHAQNLLEWSHLAYLLQLVAKIFESEFVFADLFRELGSLFLIDSLLGLFYEGKHISHAQDTAGGGALEGWGVRYSSVETYTETEQTVFEAEGVLTADGKDVAFSLSLTMARSYSQSESFEFRAGDALKDPLVINLADTFAQLQPGDTVQFDLDLDGTDDAMPFTGSGSGFLVIDNNGNGIVDNGSELFGPATGNGFQELAAYDEDKSGWIDEGDSAYARMGVWRRVGEQQVLQSLSELDIGAIYAGNITTPFAINDAQNNTLGLVRQTGLYVRDDMTVGTVQKLDVVV